ncbi:MAG: hypothetical protein Kow0062_20190 [Acidobacteriota bacterium]
MSVRATRALAAAAIVALVATAAACGREAAGAAGAARGEVLEVVDGDTLRVRTEDGPQLVRLIGIDAPELHHPEAGEQYLGAEARAFAAERLARSGVTLEPDDGQPRRDRFGRMLAYVRTDEGEDLGAALVERGFARVLTRYRFARKERYLELERRARKAGLGLWKDGGLAEVRWLLARRTPALAVLPMTGGRYAVLVLGRVRAGVSGRALSDALWAARRARGLFERDRRRAEQILDEAGFRRLEGADAASAVR